MTGAGHLALLSPRPGSPETQLPVRPVPPAELHGMIKPGHGPVVNRAGQPFQDGPRLGISGQEVAAHHGGEIIGGEERPVILQGHQLEGFDVGVDHRP